MELIKIAEKLYEMCSDMDAQDYEEQKNDDIRRVLIDLESLDRHSALLSALEIICENN